MLFPLAAQESASGGYPALMTPHPTAKWFLLLPLASAMLVGCGALEAPPQEVPYASVTFDVTAPPDTPTDAVLTVVGSDPSLGGDTSPGFHLRRQGEGHYTGLVRLRVGEDISYDLWVEQAWNPELTADGQPMPRHAFTVDGDMTVTAHVARWGMPGEGPPARSTQ